VLPGSVAEARYLSLGDLEQWVLIRGRDASNPALVVLHGGPGMAETALFRYFNAPIEDAFTVVHWDQRGAGRSFDPSIPPESMTVEQFVRDLDGLVDFVRDRLERPRVAILGHSWGSTLGALYCSRFPEKVTAYVGAAQIADSAAGESISYEWGLAEAERRGKRRALRKLRAVGPPPYDVDGLMTERMVVAGLEGMTGARSLWRYGRAALRSPEASVADLRRTQRGFRFTLDAMWDEVSRLNLIELVPELRMPTVFFIARKDRWVPPETSVAYIEALSAPSKEIVWFEGSGHEMFVDEPARFNDAMRERVLPVVVAAEGESPRAV
jgi:pimeloyl-ACP methyl ester carboxylesterase